MPKINKEEYIKPIERYSIQELAKVMQEIQRAGSEEQWLINKGVIYKSKQKGYEGQIMVRANVDAQENITCPLSKYIEILKQLHAKQDKDGKLLIFDNQ